MSDFDLLRKICYNTNREDPGQCIAYMYSYYYSSYDSYSYHNHNLVIANGSSSFTPSLLLSLYTKFVYLLILVSLNELVLTRHRSQGAHIVSPPLHTECSNTVENTCYKSTILNNTHCSTKLLLLCDDKTIQKLYEIR